MPEFTPNKPHDENVKVSVEKILGAPTTLKRAKKTAEDHQKVLFYRFIDSMIALDIRTVNLDQAFFMDMRKYDSAFYAAIDDLMEMYFNKNQIRLINFYLYERITDDGHMVELMDDTDTIIDMSTPEKLYNEVKKLK